MIAPLRATRADEIPPPGVPLFEEFEGDELEFWWSVLIEGAGSVDLSADRPYWGDQCVRLAAGGPGTDVRLLHQHPDPTYGTFGVFFYDSPDIGSGNSAGLYVSNSLTGDYFGIATPSSAEGNYQIDLPTGPLDTGYPRTAGWHLFTISTLHDGLRAGIWEEEGDPSVVYFGDARPFDAAALRMTASASGTGGAAYFDNYYVAWECEAPEPGTAALLFAGALVTVGAIKCARMKKRKIGVSP